LITPFIFNCANRKYLHNPADFFAGFFVVWGINPTQIDKTIRSIRGNYNNRSLSALTTKEKERTETRSLSVPISIGTYRNAGCYALTRSLSVFPTQEEKRTEMRSLSVPISIGTYRNVRV